MQIALVMLGWFLWHVTENWARYPAFAWFRIKKRQTPRQAWEAALEVQEKLSAYEAADALKRALTEFQKAQSWFMLAVQVAALVALSNPKYLDVSSWQQLW